MLREYYTTKPQAQFDEYSRSLMYYDPNPISCATLRPPLLFTDIFEVDFPEIFK